VLLRSQVPVAVHATNPVPLLAAAWRPGTASEYLLGGAQRTLQLVDMRQLAPTPVSGAAGAEPGNTITAGAAVSLAMPEVGTYRRLEEVCVAGCEKCSFGFYFVGTGSPLCTWVDGWVPDTMAQSSARSPRRHPQRCMESVCATLGGIRRRGRRRQRMGRTHASPVCLWPWRCGGYGRYERRVTRFPLRVNIKCGAALLLRPFSNLSTRARARTKSTCRLCKSYAHVIVSHISNSSRTVFLTTTLALVLALPLLRQGPAAHTQCGRCRVRRRRDVAVLVARAP